MAAHVEVPGTSGYVQLGGVRLSEAAAEERDETRALVRVPRSDVTSVEVQYAVGGERPIVTLILGLALVAVAIIPLLTLLDVYRRGGTFHAEWIAAVACIIPALWLLDLSLRRRWLLLVHTRRGRRKLLFPKGTTQVEAEAFVAAARDRFGY